MGNGVCVSQLVKIKHEVRKEHVPKIMFISGEVGLELRSPQSGSHRFRYNWIYILLGCLCVLIYLTLQTPMLE